MQAGQIHLPGQRFRKEHSYLWETLTLAGLSLWKLNIGLTVRVSGHRLVCRATWNSKKRLTPGQHPVSLNVSRDNTRAATLPHLSGNLVYSGVLYQKRLIETLYDGSSRANRELSSFPGNGGEANSPRGQKEGKMNIDGQARREWGSSYYAWLKGWRNDPLEHHAPDYAEMAYKAGQKARSDNVQWHFAMLTESVAL